MAVPGTNAPRLGVLIVEDAPAVAAALRAGLHAACMRTELAELAALETLLDAEGTSVSREWLSRVALKQALRADDRSVDRLVAELRRKLAAQGGTARVILSVRRQGYVLPDARPFRTVRGRVRA